MKSLRARLLSGMIGSLAVLLGAFGLMLDAAIEYMFVREFDFYLETLAKALAATAEAGDAGIALKLVPESLPDIPEVEGELFSQYWNEDGTVLARSANLGEEDLPFPTHEADRLQIQPFVLPDGRGARAAVIQFRPGVKTPPEAGLPDAPPGQETTVTLAVARDTTDLQSHIAELRWLLLAAGLITMSVGAGVSVFVIRRGLRPLSQVASSIAALGEDDLGANIPTGALPDEIVLLVDRLNELLRRLEHAFARERGLTADIAHELRTPVAGILSTVGVILSVERTPRDYREALEDVRQVARQMRGMIENLLLLARCDAGRILLHCELLPLGEMIAQTWQRCAEQAAARNLALHNEVPATFCCTSDTAAMDVILSNLVGNAVQYADERGVIRITACSEDGLVKLAVANTGCTLTTEQAARVFDRFWRSDASRSGGSLHVGLGLSLVRRLAESLGGSATATVDGRGLFTVRVVLPQPSG